ncbi:prenyltransferase and squalene oxidase repeat-containing domain protein [Ancylostoma ceylanicum]|uniref:Geranylgeranyl transferase type II subunit beta n=1 Tax=Ancylostoma ceylanicum TaxID=53326 RepID=A0A0D6LEV0_9BILA|nr:prenyltransferase and squalene oxidase repeat-containing domain protein [Ancylostoma ceylanicum]
MAEPLRLSGIYWCVSAVSILNKSDALSRDAIVEYIRECQRADGGFAPATHHDSHLLHTLSAVQADPFHTLFGVAGLSLLGSENLSPVDAVFCMPKSTLKEKSLC